MQACWAKRLSIALVAGALLMASPAAADGGDPCGDVPGRIAHGEVLWTANALVVQGTAAPELSDPNRPLTLIKEDTRRAATLDAYRRAAEVLAGVTISADRTGADNPRVVSNLSAYIRNPAICKTKFFSDGGVDVVVKVPLTGELALALLPQAGERPADGVSPYTGLIVDATAVGFRPALAPRLFAADGTLLFSESSVRKESLAARGAVQYVVGTAAFDPRRVGSRPLRAAAVSVGSHSPSDLVLDNRAAAELQSAPAFLGDGHIVIMTAADDSMPCRQLLNGTENRRIDWQRRIAMARGFGRVQFDAAQDDAVRIRMMERAAEVDAQRNLLEVLMELRVEGDLALKARPGAAERLQGVVRNAVRCDARYYTNGTADVVMAVPIDGLTAAAAGLDEPAPALRAPIAPDGPSGLIVDAAGLDFAPVLAPELMAADGSQLYGRHSVSRAWIREHGIAGYRATLAQARTDPRVGVTPLVVSAARLGPRPGTLVLAAAGDPAMALLKQMNVPLAQGRVIIVTATVRGGQ